MRDARLGAGSRSVCPSFPSRGAKRPPELAPPGARRSRRSRRRRARASRPSARSATGLDASYRRRARAISAPTVSDDAASSAGSSDEPRESTLDGRRAGAPTSEPNGRDARGRRRARARPRTSARARALSPRARASSAPRSTARARRARSSSSSSRPAPSPVGRPRRRKRRAPCRRPRPSRPPRPPRRRPRRRAASRARRAPRARRGRRAAPRGRPRRRRPRALVAARVRRAPSGGRARARRAAARARSTAAAAPRSRRALDRRAARRVSASATPPRAPRARARRALAGRSRRRHDVRPERERARVGAVPPGESRRARAWKPCHLSAAILARAREWGLRLGMQEIRVKMAQKAAAVSTVAASGGVGFFEGGFADGAATRDAAVTSAELPGPSARRARARGRAHVHFAPPFRSSKTPRCRRGRARVDDRSVVARAEHRAADRVGARERPQNVETAPSRRAPLKLPCWIAIRESQRARRSAPRTGGRDRRALLRAARGAAASELPRGDRRCGPRRGLRAAGDARGRPAWAIENHECWLVDRARALSAPIACRGSLGLCARREAAAALDALLLGDAPENPPPAAAGLWPLSFFPGPRRSAGWRRRRRRRRRLRPRHRRRGRTRCRGR